MVGITITAFAKGFSLTLANLNHDSLVARVPQKRPQSEPNGTFHRNKMTFCNCIISADMIKRASRFIPSRIATAREERIFGPRNTSYGSGASIA
jgi:hypothetical protein